jgi:hypothetical protein
MEIACLRARISHTLTSSACLHACLSVLVTYFSPLLLLLLVVAAATAQLWKCSVSNVQAHYFALFAFSGINGSDLSVKPGI